MWVVAQNDGETVKVSFPRNQDAAIKLLAAYKNWKNMENVPDGMTKTAHSEQRGADRRAVTTLRELLKDNKGSLFRLRRNNHYDVVIGPIKAAGATFGLLSGINVSTDLSDLGAPEEATLQIVHFGNSESGGESDGEAGENGEIITVQRPPKRERKPKAEAAEAEEEAADADQAPPAKKAKKAPRKAKKAAEAVEATA